MTKSLIIDVVSESESDSDYVSVSESESESEYDTMSIFDVPDIVEVICGNLKCFEIAAIAYVNKTCYLEYKKTYKQKYNKEFVIPFDTTYKQYEETIDYLNYAHTNISRYDNPMHYQFRNESDYVWFTKLIDQCAQNIKDMHQCWIVLVHDIDKMNTLFNLNALVYQHVKQYDDTMNIEGCNKVLKDFLKSMINLRNTLIENVKYFYIDDPNKYKVEELKLFAALKKVPKYYKLKRLQLIKNLKRPNDELYFV